MMISLTVLCRKYENIVHTDSELHLLIYSEILVQKRLGKPPISSVFSHDPTEKNTQTRLLMEWLLKAYLISVYMKFEVDQIIPVNDREPPIASIIITYDYQRANFEGHTLRVEVSDWLLPPVSSTHTHTHTTFHHSKFYCPIRKPHLTRLGSKLFRWFWTLILQIYTPSLKWILGIIR